MMVNPLLPHHPHNKDSTKQLSRSALMASSIGGAAYVMNNGDDKDTSNGFEFTRRKKWPQLLLQELVGSALFCLKPIPGARQSVGQSNGQAMANDWSWKIIYVSPSTTEMLSKPPQTLEQTDFFNLILPSDQPHLQHLFLHLLNPNNNASTSSTSRSATAYIRMLSGKGQAGVGGGGGGGQETVVWEVRAHATGLDMVGGVNSTEGGFNMGGAGTVVPQGGGIGDVKGRAIWVMGRRVGDMSNEGDSNGQSIDAFLELKLENERYREELRELQQDLGEDDIPYRNYIPASPMRPHNQSYNLNSSSASSSSTSSSRSSTPTDDNNPPSSLYPANPNFPSSSSSKPHDPTKPPKSKIGRPPKDKAAAPEKKRKKVDAGGTGAGGGGRGGGGAGGENEGIHVCVTCGRTDSPEWRKGPLGPKTLCNACGLRWAKRNSTQPSRKERKAMADAKTQT